MLLAGIGLYGVMSYAVSQSTRELGLRMALGAAPSHLLRLVMSRGVTLTAGGVALGAGAALLLTRLLGYLLYQVSPRDPLSFGLAFAVMIVAAMAASLVPALARHADRSSPRIALGVIGAPAVRTRLASARPSDHCVKHHPGPPVEVHRAEWPGRARKPA